MGSVAASRQLQIATRFFERHSRQPPRRFSFGTWALAAQLSVRSVGRTESTAELTRVTVLGRNQFARIRQPDLELREVRMYRVALPINECKARRDTAFTKLEARPSRAPSSIFSRTLWPQFRTEMHMGPSRCV
jgi:hypothetical protein